MKKILAVLLLSAFAPIATQASIVTFQCKSAEVTGVHKFDAKGIVTIDEQNNVEGIISIQTQKAQAEGSVQIFEEIKINGSRKHFKAGEFTSNEFDQYTLQTNDSYIKSLNLLVDFKVEIASQIFTVDNFLFRSNCETVESK